MNVDFVNTSSPSRSNQLQMNSSFQQSQQIQGPSMIVPDSMNSGLPYRRNRKRKRGALYSGNNFFSFASTNDYMGEEPPPFAPANLSLLKSYHGPLSRSLTSGLSPLIVNLVLVAGHRLKARDFTAAASVIPTLLKRYRKLGSHRWFFSREITITGAEVLRRAKPHNPELLDAFLAQISRDGSVASRSGNEGYATHTRDMALLERVMELIASGNIKDAYTCLYEQSQEESFQANALTQGFLGVVSLAIGSKDSLEHIPMLRIAARALHTASQLDPAAYFYVHYAAATEMAAGRQDEALNLLRNFVEECNRTDPIALFGILSCLETVPKRRQERIDLARRLIKIDPLSNLAMDTLREGYAWKWAVSPPVDRIEMAELYGNRIEHGEDANVQTWKALATVLLPSVNERQLFWEFSGRKDWWPTHYFRPTRLNGDIAINPQLAAVKGAVTKLLMHPEPCAYAMGVECSGIINLYNIEDSNTSATLADAFT